MFTDLSKVDILDDPFNYMLEVYNDNYIVLTIPRIQAQLHHVSNEVMTGIHDLFPLDNDDDEDAIFINKIIKKEGAWAVLNNVLKFDFEFNPGEHTIWPTEDHRTNILTRLKEWIRKGDHI